MTGLLQAILLCAHGCSPDHPVLLTVLLTRWPRFLAALVDRVRAADADGAIFDVEHLEHIPGGLAAYAALVPAGATRGRRAHSHQPQLFELNRNPLFVLYGGSRGECAGVREQGPRRPRGQVLQAAAHLRGVARPAGRPALQTLLCTAQYTRVLKARTALKVIAVGIRTEFSTAVRC
jgi:hypothetical protein